VVGFSRTPTGGLHAFITGLDGEGMRALATVGAGARGINESGQVVGNYRTAGLNSHAFITGPDGMEVRDLGTLGGDLSIAYGINGAGQAVGYAYTTAKGYSPMPSSLVPTGWV
jgi:probable HAF family extracellular repeat protein